MCLQLGIDDPEQWLENAPKRVVDLWDDYWKIEPWGLPWHQSAQISTLLDWIYSLLLVKNGSKRDPRPFTDYMPANYSDGDQPTKPNLMQKLVQLAKRGSKNEHNQ